MGAGQHWCRTRGGTRRRWQPGLFHSEAEKLSLQAGQLYNTLPVAAELVRLRPGVDDVVVTFLGTNLKHSYKTVYTLRASVMRSYQETPEGRNVVQQVIQRNELVDLPAIAGPGELAKAAQRETPLLGMVRTGALSDQMWARLSRRCRAPYRRTARARTSSASRSVIANASATSSSPGSSASNWATQQRLPAAGHPNRPSVVETWKVPKLVRKTWWFVAVRSNPPPEVGRVNLVVRRSFGRIR